MLYSLGTSDFSSFGTLIILDKIERLCAALSTPLFEEASNQDNAFG